MDNLAAPGAKTVISELIDATPAGISRAEIATATGFSSSTVSNIVRELINTGEVDESPTASTGGRRTQVLKPTHRHDPIWLSEIGSAHARIGIADRPGNLVATEEVPVSLTDRPQVVLSRIIEHLKVLSEKALAKPSAAALGIALPGPVDRSLQMVVGAARMPGWNNVPLAPILNELVLAPVEIDNDARAGAIGECAMREDAPGTWNGIYVKAGTGIGGAAVLNGEIYTGGGGLAGDIAHNSVPEAGDRPCSCGRAGCMETVASGAGIIRALGEEGIDVHTVAQVVERAEQWDPVVTAMLRSAGTSVGRVLAPLVTFLNPTDVIVGGSLSSIDVFTASIRSELYARCLPMTTKDLTIEASLTKADAALYGMAELCFAAINRTNQGAPTSS
ncbi:transcriptional regulator/sugar kinase [Corynebacterium mustelae]|uniref:Transcriptional regulator/sugar kinase n=1 Tax=Corynebacterium mustelae TaxID=571915 RepID=A0A0G3GVI9_9CORY|nr:ROK family protein [Corynebacterium mustelae]AKK05166.1 transcriptional regulator/sugar kinase [Corynebacterium mustelae]